MAAGLQKNVGRDDRTPHDPPDPLDTGRRAAIGERPTPTGGNADCCWGGERTHRPNNGYAESWIYLL